MDAEITQYRKEFAKEIERHGDVLDEPDLSNITNVYDEHLRYLNYRYVTTSE